MATLNSLRALLANCRRVGIDSSVFIYTFEQHPRFEPLCALVFQFLSDNRIHVVTSAITVSEVLIKPILDKDSEIVAQYEQAFATLPNFTLVALDYGLARTAAHLRARYNIRLPDAFQIAAALHERADIFITNDRALKKIKEVKIITLTD